MKQENKPQKNKERSYKKPGKILLMKGKEYTMKGAISRTRKECHYCLFTLDIRSRFLSKTKTKSPHGPEGPLLHMSPPFIDFSTRAFPCEARRARPTLNWLLLWIFAFETWRVFQFQ